MVFGSAIAVIAIITVGYDRKGQRILRLRAKQTEVVGQIMTKHVHTGTVDQPIASVVPLFSDTGLHHLPIVDANPRLVGILTQSDLVAALYRSR